MKIETFEAWNTKTFKDLKSIKRLVEDRHYYTSLEYCFNEKQKEIQSLKEKLKVAEKELEGAMIAIRKVENDLRSGQGDKPIAILVFEVISYVRHWLTQNNQTKGE